VAQAVTFAVPDPTFGEDVGAVIVLRDHSTATAAEIRDFAATRLVDFKVPRFVLFSDAIPKGPTGKLQRIGLAQVLEVSSPARPNPPAARDFTPARSTLEHRLAGLWADVLKVERPGIHEHFLDLGGDSMLAALLVSRIREELQLELSLRSLFDAPTVAEQSAVIEESLRRSIGDLDRGGVRAG
jgi:acyl carrier protein